MKLDAIVIAVLYNHFYNMKMKGRKVIPWFQTVSTLSFIIVIICTLLSVIIIDVINGKHYSFKADESSFIIGFMIFLIGLFFFLKKFYFDSNKHLIFYESFQSLPDQKQKKYRIITLTAFTLLPIFLYLVIVYIAFFD